MKIKMLLIMVMMLVSSIAITTNAIAHPPQDMILEYDLDLNKLDVTITHNSPGPTFHYINQVDINKNDELVISENYQSQPTTSTFTYTYSVEADIGDELKVIAYCNIQGSITKTITVADPSQDDPPIVEIVNPTEGYFHFSGIRLFPASGLIADTMGFGGFRLRPLQFYTDDDIDANEDLELKVYIEGVELGIASYNSNNELHELKWTGPNLGTFTLSVTAEDSTGNIGEDELEVWYFCFIP